MGTAHKAVSGVAWTIATGGVARMLGLVGTVVLTHFLAPDVRFRRLGIGKALAEASVPIVAVTAAWAGAGGMALVYSNLSRALVNLVMVSTAMDRREWLEPTRIEMKIVKML